MTFAQKFILALALVATTIALFAAVSILSKTKSSEDGGSVRITLPAGYSHEELALQVGTALGWNTETQDQFLDAVRGIKWDTFNDDLVAYLANELGWGDAEREVFLTQSILFLNLDDSILEALYVPGDYVFEKNATPVEIAEALVSRVMSEHSDTAVFLRERIDENIESRVSEFVKGRQDGEFELAPDLVPLPAQDVELRDDGGRTLLAFSTTYYNIGRGKLELVADPVTAGIRDDIERTVFQRIYKTDGTYRERPSGTFLWHQEHLHYHFSDFAEYSLEAASGTPEIQTGKLREKSTFCIRDVSRVHISGVRTSAPAEYLICGKEKQGVSVGWGDTYFYTYADQNIDVTTIPSGTYNLITTVNSSDRFDEVIKNNNVSVATIEIDKKNMVVAVIGTNPEELPEFEHVHVEQVFSN